MLKFAICDDNSMQVDLLGDILEEYLSGKGVEGKISKFSSGLSLLDAVRENGFFDVYILDMIMPGANGLETASTLRMMKDPGVIIFLTATVEYAVMSYDVKAHYYLVKPLDTPKLYKVLDDALSTLKKQPKSFVIKNHNCETKLFLEDVMYVDIENRCPVYHTKDGKEYSDKVIRGTFKEAVQNLFECSDFVFCGSSTVINKRYVDVIDSESVLLKGGVLLYPSKSGIADLKKSLRQQD